MKEDFGNMSKVDRSNLPVVILLPRSNFLTSFPPGYPQNLCISAAPPIQAHPRRGPFANRGEGVGRWTA
jgi:hypothetical protein